MLETKIDPLISQTLPQPSAPWELQRLIPRTPSLYQMEMANNYTAFMVLATGTVFSAPQEKDND